MIFYVIAITILFFWLAGITYYFFRLQKRYSLFLENTDKKTIDEVLTKILKENTVSKKAITTLNSRCDSLEQADLLHIQKIGLLRFNPFNDTGGEQSFILAMIDAKDSGVVITALYARSGTRWYAKQIKHGKGVEHELSDEEKKAITIAKKIK